MKPSCLRSTPSLPQTGDFNIITLDHMKKLENLLSLRTPDTLTTIDLAGSQGLEGMKVDTVKPQKIVFVFPIGHGVIVSLVRDASQFRRTLASSVLWCHHIPSRWLTLVSLSERRCWGQEQNAAWYVACGTLLL